ncbi:co-chaperone GroES [Candidatus Microgenomates bacterium]|nr:co-chaperone GroES [Candidatus Microgenomates bacterium]
MPKVKSTATPAPKINILPTAGNILLEPEEAMRQTASGIVLPESASEKPQLGKVLAIGDDEITEHGKKSAPCKVGETVYYKKWGGNDLKVEGREYMLVKFDDILAVKTA